LKINQNVTVTIDLHITKGNQLRVYHMPNTTDFHTWSNLVEYCGMKPGQVFPRLTQRCCWAVFL